VPEDVTFTVSELNRTISGALEEAFPGEIWVRGEIQQYHVSRNQHTYFELVEKDPRRDQPLATLRVALFRQQRPAVNRALKEVPGVRLGDGAEVRLRARVDFWPPAGRLQLVMTGIDPVFTIGKLAADRERVLRALAADGLLRRNGALPLALVPLRVGLVASQGSAAYHDFIETLSASGYAFRVAVADVRVQGAAASRRLVYGLRRLAQLDVDVVVLVRGGGPRSDLAPYDTELVARTIAEMPVPVITGIGHEVDRTVADEVAHTYCKTPTACATTLVEQVAKFAADLDRAAHRVVLRARAATALANREIAEIARRIRRAAPGALAVEAESLDECARQVVRRARRVVEHSDRRLTGHQEMVVRAARRATRDAERQLQLRERRIAVAGRRLARSAALHVDNLDARLRALDPRGVLDRGYTITRAADGAVVKRAGVVSPGTLLVTEFADGTATSRVERVESRNEEDAGG